MDLRKWLVLNDLPASAELDALVERIPCSDHRTANVLKLYTAARRSGYKLTDAQGTPTDALRLMVTILQQETPEVALCLTSDLPPEEEKAFGKDGRLFTESAPWWCIRGVTHRVKLAQNLQYHGRPWLHRFLPGLAGERIMYGDLDGRRRRRVCYIAICPTNWEMTEIVYEGVWRWNNEHRDWKGGWGYKPAKCPDGYAILGSDPALGAAGGEGTGGPAVDAVGTAS